MPVSQKTLNERSQQFSQTIHRLVISKLSDLGKKVNAAATGMRDAADSTDNGFETTSDIHLDFAAGVCRDIISGIDTCRKCIAAYRQDDVVAPQSPTAPPATEPAKE